MKKAQLMQLFLVIVLITLSHPVFSQLQRNFPPDSKLGKLTAVSFPQFTINGQKMIMAPGGQIRGVDNLIILPSVANYIGTVRYQLDIMGNLHRVWILTPDEVKAAEHQGQQIPAPKKRFFFF
ncbi:MAG: hypothetical protein Q7J23_02710 [Nitrosomonas sp.]|jgi:hypothetical protein|uniref:hypothetical protein n=1 Tax=Nitrosomonas sp. TaxID=42353 RepID=UPI00271AF5C7|nr:hypothetical protein [Nitrosomonas sp.]MDO8894880.1 hypothetical protein [Nitrosomonas sp.]MDO9469626.1 hypothetical protein [Nitrosomonas sp.]MDP1550598.1 hypothetical protein [Nitrosomonas sp.]MDP1786697.1 hypothetical protein [Nitrosomonas sp.]MDP1934251.1 hypothetical protein [Nitrosomonas sp.]